MEDGDSQAHSIPGGVAVTVGGDSQVHSIPGGMAVAVDADGALQVFLVRARRRKLAKNLGSPPRIAIRNKHGNLSRMNGNGDTKLRKMGGNGSIKLRKRHGKLRNGGLSMNIGG